MWERRLGIKDRTGGHYTNGPWKLKGNRLVLFVGIYVIPFGMQVHTEGAMVLQVFLVDSFLSFVN